MNKMQKPTGAIGENEIAVTMDGGECVAVMKAIKSRIVILRSEIMDGNISYEEEYMSLLSFTDKVSSLVSEMARRSRKKVNDILGGL